MNVRLVDDFLGIGGLATIFLTRAHIDCRLIFWLDIVDDFDFYRIFILKGDYSKKQDS